VRTGSLSDEERDAEPMHFLECERLYDYISISPPNQQMFNISRAELLALLAGAYRLHDIEPKLALARKALDAHWASP
jgi:hypothetical protein